MAKGFAFDHLHKGNDGRCAQKLPNGAVCPMDTKGSAACASGQCKEAELEKPRCRPTLQWAEGEQCYHARHDGCGKVAKRCKTDADCSTTGATCKGSRCTQVIQHEVGKATQSSTYRADNIASVAMNSNPATFTHTKTETNPWWRLDLGDKMIVQQVEITNRADCCGDRLNGAKVMVGLSDVPMETAWVAGKQASNLGWSCLTTSGTYSSELDAWSGTLAQAESKCNGDSKCTILHNENNDGKNWRACKSVIYTNTGKAATKVEGGVHVPGSFAYGNSQCGGTLSGAVAKKKWTLTCKKDSGSAASGAGWGLEGRYVFVQLPGAKKTLSLSHVKVYADATEEKDKEPMFCKGLALQKNYCSAMKEDYEGCYHHGNNEACLSGSCKEVETGVPLCRPKAGWANYKQCYVGRNSECASGKCAQVRLGYGVCKPSAGLATGYQQPVVNGKRKYEPGACYTQQHSQCETGYCEPCCDGAGRKLGDARCKDTIGDYGKCPAYGALGPVNEACTSKACREISAGVRLCKPAKGFKLGHQCSDGRDVDCASAGQYEAKSWYTGGTADQSTTYSAQTTAQRALDGKSDTISHTNTQTSPWWRWDLKATKRIVKIEITNRNSHGYRLNGAIVKVAKSSKICATCGTQCGAPISGAKDGDVHTRTCAGNVEGSWIQVLLPGSNKILQLTKVRAETAVTKDRPGVCARVRLLALKGFKGVCKPHEGFENGAECWDGQHGQCKSKYCHFKTHRCAPKQADYTNCVKHDGWQACISGSCKEVQTGKALCRPKVGWADDKQCYSGRSSECKSGKCSPVRLRAGLGDLAYCEPKGKFADGKMCYGLKHGQCASGLCKGLGDKAYCHRKLNDYERCSLPKTGDIECKSGTCTTVRAGSKSVCRPKAMFANGKECVAVVGHGDCQSGLCKNNGYCDRRKKDYERCSMPKTGDIECESGTCTTVRIAAKSVCRPKGKFPNGKECVFLAGNGDCQSGNCPLNGYCANVHRHHRHHIHIPHNHHIHIPHVHIPHKHHIHWPHVHIPHNHHIHIPHRHHIHHRHGIWGRRRLLNEESGGYLQQEKEYLAKIAAKKQ